MVATLAASTTFDPTELDALLDCLRDSPDPGATLERYVEPMVWSRAQHMICEVFEFIDRAQNRLLALDQLRWKLGITTDPGRALSCAEIARRHGVRKQAVVQGADRLTAILGLRKSANGRSEDARSKFAKTHYRGRK